MRDIARSLVPRQDVDDLVQDAALELFKAKPEISGDERAYLAACMFQRWRKWRVAATRKKRDVTAVCIDDESVALAIPCSPAVQLLVVELREIVGTFQQLPKNWQNSLALSMDGMTVSEIAREFDCTRNSVMIWLANARRVIADPDLLGTRLTTRGGVTAKGAVNYDAAD
jgi:RNA polymerase sigma factor (sigma-70 family)